MCNVVGDVSASQIIALMPVCAAIHLPADIVAMVGLLCHLFWIRCRHRQTTVPFLTHPQRSHETGVTPEFANEQDDVITSHCDAMHADVMM